ncbi:MAG: SBBP repeat-containing protein [Candidatus Binataceae bacterium]
MSNYLIGSKPSNWKRHVPNFAGVRYEQLYPGIDVRYHGEQGKLEYDLIVSPDADLGQFEMSLEGADRVDVDSDGNLSVALSDVKIVFHRPLAFQEIDGTRVPVSAHFSRIANTRIKIDVPHYDHHAPLIVDPTVSYSTYLGGLVAAGRGIAVDSTGAAYVTGWTAVVSDFPTTPGAYQTTLNPGDGGVDAFLTKFSPDGSSLSYSTYLGGSGVDEAFGVAVDSEGHAYVAGFTNSPDFPQLNTAVQHGNKGSFDVFVTKVDATGDALDYSTLLGGSAFEIAEGIAVDSSANAYVVGYTNSMDFPTTSTAVQPQFPSTAPANEGFVTKLTTESGTVGIGYSTFFGAPNNPPSAISGTNITSVSVDAVGNVYIAGAANSGLPLTTGPPFAGATDAFVAKIDTTRAGYDSLRYSRYLGGRGNDFANAIAIAAGCTAECQVYVTGGTDSQDFPVTVASTSYVGENDTFVAELDPEARTIYANYLGSAGFSLGVGVTADSLGQVFALGVTTDSKTFPTVNPAQSFPGVSGRVAKSQDGGLTEAYTNWPADTAGSPEFQALALDTALSPAGLYVGTQFDGIWKSPDGGNTYSQTAFPVNKPVRALAYSEQITPSRLYAGTQGLFVSTDGGNSFFQLTGFPPLNVFSIAVGDERHPLDLYVGTDRGFYYSRDGGLSFARSSGVPGNTTVRCSAADEAGALYVGTDSGVLRSTDDGATFQPTNLNFTTTYALAVDTSSSPPTVYAGNLGSLVASHDGFNMNISFLPVPATLPDVFSLSVDNSSSSSPKAIIAGVYEPTAEFSEVYRSTDGGNTFTQVFSGFAFPGVFNDIVVDSRNSPATVYGGLLETSDGTVTQFNSRGSELLFSTPLGGSEYDFPLGIVLGPSADPYASGTTTSPDFPTTSNAFQTSQNGSLSTFVTKYVNTFIGKEIEVAASTALSLVFDQVSSPGDTSVTSSTAGPNPPPGVSFGNPPQYYAVATSAGVSGPIQVCVRSLNPGGIGAELFQFQSGNWVSISDRTIATNVAVCGITNSLSTFAVGEGSR